MAWRKWGSVGHKEAQTPSPAERRNPVNLKMMPEHAGTLTSQPFRVVLDGAENRAALSQTPVNHRVARQEVRHGGRVEIAPWGDRTHGRDQRS